MFRIWLRLVPAAALAVVLVVSADRCETSAQEACDPSYPYVCLPPGRDITCFDIGFPIAVVHDPGNGRYDPYNLDPDLDGVGCEGF